MSITQKKIKKTKPKMALVQSQSCRTACNVTDFFDLLQKFIQKVSNEQEQTYIINTNGSSLLP